MRKIVTFFCVLLAAASVTACAPAGEPPVGVTQGEADTGGSDLESEPITDKNLKLKEPYVYAIEREEMDGFWDSYLPDIAIQNEWVHADDGGYDIAIFGALKENPKQGTADLIEVSPDFIPYAGVLYVAVSADSTPNLLQKGACLKIHSPHLYATLRGRFEPNLLSVARYAALI